MEAGVPSAQPGEDAGLHLGSPASGSAFFRSGLLPLCLDFHRLARDRHHCRWSAISGIVRCHEIQFGRTLPCRASSLHNVLSSLQQGIHYSQ